MTTLVQKSVKSARKAKGDGHLRRAEILKAAERIFVAEGYEGATIRKIADDVGVSSTALYMHFRDKDQILLEICTSTMEQLLIQNQEISTRPVDCVVRVRLILEAYIRFALNHQNAYRLVFCSSQILHAKAEDNTTAEIGAACYSRFTDVVREIAANGRLRAVDDVTAAQVLWSACHGLAALVITKPEFNWASADDLIQVMLDSLLHGLIAD